MKLNKEELLIASILTIVASNNLLAIPFCAFLWALTGSESKYNYKAWRRIGVPTVWALTYGFWGAFLLVPLTTLFLSMGYGIPSTQPPDEGSTLGKFFYKLTGGNTLYSNILTRGLIYTGATLPFVILRFT